MSRIIRKKKNLKFDIIIYTLIVVYNFTLNYGVIENFMFWKRKEILLSKKSPNKIVKYSNYNVGKSLKRVELAMRTNITLKVNM